MALTHIHKHYNDTIKAMYSIEALMKGRLDMPHDMSHLLGAIAPSVEKPNVVLKERDDSTNNSIGNVDLSIQDVDEPVGDLKDIFNTSLSAESRFELLKAYDFSVAQEIFYKILHVCELSGTMRMNKLLDMVCHCEYWDFEFRICCIESMMKSRNKNIKTMGNECLLSQSHELKKLNSSIRLKWLVDDLYNLDNDRFLELFIEFLYDRSILDEFRYKALRVNNGKVPYDTLLSILYEWIFDETIGVRTRILACQQFLDVTAVTKGRNDDIARKHKSVMGQLVCFYRVEKYDERARADAADIVLNIVDESTDGKEQKQDALDTLMTLGGGRDRNVYTNTENVHLVLSDANDLFRCIEFLKSDEDTLYELGVIVKELEKSGLIDDKERFEKAMYRIEVDSSTFKNDKEELRLSDVFIRLYTFIRKHEYSEELTKRLVEELLDSSNTCTSGYIFRLINVLSGGYVDGIHIAFNWEDEMHASLEARLLKAMKDARFEDIGQELLEIDIENKPHIRDYVRNQLLSIREGMYNEYHSLMDDTDFDLNFCKALKRLNLL